MPGQRLDAIGGDRSAKTEFDPGILERARTVVEFEEQKRIKGEIRQMPTGFPVTEPRWIIIGHLAGLRHSDEVTLFDSAGFALKDPSASRCIREPAAPVGGSSSCRRSPTRGTCLASFGKQPGPPSTKADSLGRTGRRNDPATSLRLTDTDSHHGRDARASLWTDRNRVKPSVLSPDSRTTVKS